MRDTRVLSLAARGGWVDVLCMLHGNSIRGTMTLPLIGWARVMSVSVDQADAVVTELDVMKVADVQRHQNGDVTLSSRRMLREHITREQTRLRVQRHRRKHSGNADGNGTVTDNKSETRNQKPEASSARARHRLPDSLNTAQFRERWLRWQTHWSEQFNHGNPMPEMTAYQHLEDLVKIGEERAINAINNAISMGKLRKPAEPFSNGEKPRSEPAVTRI